MPITDDILYDILKETYPVRRYGGILPDHPLRLPVFYDGRTEPERDQVYVLPTQELPAAPEEKCLYLCVGAELSPVADSYCGEVFHVRTSDADILDVFNQTQRIYAKLLNWEAGLRRLLHEGADIREMVRISIPIFENRIIVVDSLLRTVAFCRSEEAEGHREIRLSDQVDRIPDSRVCGFRSSYYAMRETRRPFLYHDGEYSSYCINLHLGSSYVGVCALTEDLRSFRESDFLLFQTFADVILQALNRQDGQPDGSLPTMKTILSRLLHSQAVDRKELDLVLDDLRRTCAVSDPSFLCIVLKSRDGRKQLPAEYLCSVLEELLPRSSALEYDKTLAVFCCIPSKDAQKTRRMLTNRLVPLLQKLNFFAGVSDSFTDIRGACSGYRQACCALETGVQQSPSDSLFYYTDYVLTYMLGHCSGGLNAQEIMPSGLLQLKDSERGSMDLETLRCYLDNECNASRTAEAMYLHRSSLAPRLERIRSYVDLDTPEQRLYLRICLHMMQPKEAAGSEKDIMSTLCS